MRLVIAMMQHETSTFAGADTARPSRRRRTAGPLEGKAAEACANTGSALAPISNWPPGQRRGGLAVAASAAPSGRLTTPPMTI